MAKTTEKLSNSQLSAQDLKELADWPDALTEDYINRVRDLVTLANEIDANAGEILRGLDKARQESAANRSGVAQVAAQVRRAKQAAASASTEAAAVGARVDDIYEFFPVKACSFQIQGNGAGVPSTVHSYNVDSIVRGGTGNYQIILQQDTINGTPIDDRATFALEYFIAPSASTDHFRVEVGAISGSNIYLNVYEVLVGAGGAGSDLAYSPYDLTTSDYVFLTVLMNAGSGKLPPA